MKSKRSNYFSGFEIDGMYIPVFPVHPFTIEKCRHCPAAVLTEDRMTYCAINNYMRARGDEIWIDDINDIPLWCPLIGKTDISFQLTDETQEKMLKRVMYEKKDKDTHVQSTSGNQ